MNTQNGTSFLQMQDSVMKVAGEILDRMAELKAFTMTFPRMQRIAKPTTMSFMNFKLSLIPLSPRNLMVFPCSQLTSPTITL